MELKNVELQAVEVAVKFVEVAATTELEQLQLAMVGGGSADPHFF
jgi:hypothetical protein